MDYQQIVKEAAVWLDEVEPGWWKRIDRGKLDLVDSCACILGQLYTSYGIARGRIFRDKTDLNTTYPLGKAFAPSDARIKEVYWLAEIESRLDSDKQSKFIERTNTIINEHPPFIKTGRELVCIKEEVNA